LDSRSLEFFAIGNPTAFHFPHSFSSLLGGYVPCRRGLLEFPWRGRFWIPDQSTDRLLLRDRHGLNRKPRACFDDGRLWNDGGWAGTFLPALHHSRTAHLRALAIPVRSSSTARTRMRDAYWKGVSIPGSSRNSASSIAESRWRCCY